MKFDDLELSDPILRSLQNQKYKEPTPIQSKVIPEIANGKDVMAAAQTGTGKTAAFVLPILNKLTHPKEKFKGHRLRALIVTPTRELAIQVRENINTYSKYLSIRSTAVYGGAKIHNQRLKLRKGVDILVHEVYSSEGFETKSNDWKIYHKAHHTSSIDLGILAKEINPKILVPSHILFWGASENSIMKDIKLNFSGKVILAKDLLVIE